MIIRKPYAFLMKNFKKIHILLLLLSIYIFYKSNAFYSFVKQSTSSGIYNSSLDSVSNYASQFFYLAILIFIGIIVAIVVLLKKKKKPIIDYIIVISEYVFVFVSFIITARYFNNLGNATIQQTQIRPLRDLLLICTIPQYIVFILLIIRILGIDLNRFGFKDDEEFKEITEEDREEVEVAVEFDKDIYKRQLKKTIRFLKYYYKENTFFLNIIFSVISVFIVISIGTLISRADKTYLEKRTFKTANGYHMTVNKSYTSLYDMGGTTIEKGSGFVVVDVTVKNNNTKRTMDIDKILLVSSEGGKTYSGYIKKDNINLDGYSNQKILSKNSYLYKKASSKSDVKAKIKKNTVVTYNEKRCKTENNETYCYIKYVNRGIYVPTLKYNNSFKDLGKGFVKKDFSPNSTNNFILVYKVDKEVINKKFVIYYQNIRGKFDVNYLKVKLKPKELITKNTSDKVNLGDTLNIGDKQIKIDSYEIGDNYSYLREACLQNGCEVVSEFLLGNGKKIVKLSLDTNDYSGNTFIDFLNTCGTIIYRVDGKKIEEKITNPITYQYRGSNSYFLVNNDIEKADQIYLKIKLRNNQYTYYLKGGKSNEGNDS